MTTTHLRQFWKESRHHIPRLLSIIAITASIIRLTSAGPAWGETWTKVADIVPPFGEELGVNSHIGYSAGISESGKWIFLGGYYSGGVVRWDGAKAHFRALPDAVPSDESVFGVSGDCTESFVLVGAPGSGGKAGTVNVYDASSLGTPVATLSGVDGQFGFSIAGAGGTAIVGAPMADGGRGTASILTKRSEGWVISQEVARGDVPTTARFGKCVSMDNQEGVRYAAVNSPGHDDLKGVYIYRRPKGGSTFKIDGILNPEGSPGQVAISDLQVAACYGEDATVRVWTRFGTDPMATWNPTPKTINLGVRGASDFSLAMNGDRLAIGMPSSKTVQIYRKGGSTWSLEQTLTNGADGFGTSVAMNDRLLVVGAPLVDYEAIPCIGAAYLYELK